MPSRMSRLGTPQNWNQEIACLGNFCLLAHAYPKIVGEPALPAKSATTKVLSQSHKNVPQSHQ